MLDTQTTLPSVFRDSVRNKFEMKSFSTVNNKKNRAFGMFLNTSTQLEKVNPAYSFMKEKSAK